MIRIGQGVDIHPFVSEAAFYVWTATSSQYQFVWNTAKQDHYNLLADGLLRGLGCRPVPLLGHPDFAAIEQVECRFNRVADTPA